jgi:hypothetical protein
MAMACATAGDIATVLWAMLLLSVTTLVQVAVKTVAQLLTPTVSLCFACGFQLRYMILAVIIIISWLELGNLPIDHSKQCVS